MAARPKAHHQLETYTPPEFVKGQLRVVPSHRLRLARTPTPLRPWQNLPSKSSAQFFIKLDEETGFGVSGNKIRKLEFLLADAIAKGHDCVVTAGGIQSNHCRATAVAAREVNIDSVLLLRYSGTSLPSPLEGNLMLARLVGAEVKLCSVDELKQKGGYNAIFEDMVRELRSRGKNPYVIPVGGSNAIGTFGYIEAAAEIIQQLAEERIEIDDVVVSCGSGGTTAGLAAGFALAKSTIKVYGMCACDDAAYFHNYINTEIFQPMGAPFKSEQVITIVDDTRGIGYAKSTPEELELLFGISKSTGVFLDPVYTLKAANGMLKHEEEYFAGRRVLFVHTGGFFGIYEKSDELAKVVTSPVSPMYPK